MKSFLTCILLITSFLAIGQTKTISGIAMDTTYGRMKVRIVKNDTLEKFSKALSSSIEQADTIPLNILKQKIEVYKSILDDKAYHTLTDSTGKFSIEANINDSLTFSSFNHNPAKYSVKDLLKMSNIYIRLKPIPCEPYVRCKDTIPKNTYAFVAEKIEVKRLNRNYCGIMVMFNGEYSAKYRIVKNIYGNFKSDTINFTAYDHYGKPAFSRHRYVLLFVSQYCNKLIHNQYQYFEVYPTADGRWATPGDPYRYDSYVKEKSIKAQPVMFENKLLFSIKKARKNYLSNYEKPYYQIIHGEARPLLGTYAEDLFKIKKQGALKRLNLK
ncbi:hypothetical protein FPZ43_17285 [Mucilaginibacter pallidiroseus]|uniref:GLPGLI family protein n=1 Tax=Mucilaginibacter pallidiroseus TaxID=2599295 RepID=A0A563U0Z0_9SPHI|nr:hypothetical protein [Mucilaginibacter pallidiroseus]TWR25223.1 hypothetical protein FPZ43_17285 [Mucilaginibacter pallidiroseus]